MKSTKMPWALALWIAVMCSLAGCGGGGGNSSNSAVAFTPNFISSLDSLNHWSFLPIKVYFALPADWTVSYPATLPAQAAVSWNTAGKQALLSVVVSSAQADVTCSFVSAPLAQWEPGTVAITHYSIDTSQHLMVPGTVSVTCSLRDKNGRALTTSEMQTSIAHELGHVLGMSGHSPNPGDLLYAIQQQGISTPQTQDLNTAMSAYLAYFSTGASASRMLERVNRSAVVERTIH